MTEDEARHWLADRGWGSGLAAQRIAQLTARVRAESAVQNLVSRSTLDTMLTRHIVDSLQLLAFLPETIADGPWIDLGTGAGFPGLAVACVIERPVLLVEQRSLRVKFLTETARALGLDHVTLVASKVESLPPMHAAVISARAFAPLDRLLATACHLSSPETVWLLPKGRSAEKELALTTRQWQGLFHVEHSITDPDSRIVVATKVAQRNPRPTARPSSRPTKAHRSDS